LKKNDELYQKFRELKRELEPKDFIGKSEQFVNIIDSVNEKLNLGMESYDSVLFRAKYMIEEIKKSSCKNIIIVSHSGFISTLIPQMYNIPENVISGGNCAISYHVYDGDNFHMISSPDNSHINLE
jgi:broad specificity phosphatase PhoE